MSTATIMRTSTNTRTQTAVFLTDTIMGSFSSFVAALGLSSAYLDGHWQTIEDGLAMWIEEGSLKQVTLEFGPQDRPHAVFEIPVKYEWNGSGDVGFVANKARLARYLAKLESVPAGTSYRVVASHNGTYTSLPGWTSTTAADTSGMSSFGLGGLGRAPDGSVSGRYLTRGG